MSEELKQIEEARQAQMRRAASQSTDLTGEQVFIRTCNTCHPGAKKGMGPALDQIDHDFQSDDKLKAFIRSGKGIMPGQSKSVLNDKELDNLIVYLRAVKERK